MMTPNFRGSDYKPYDRAYPPEEYADFLAAEDDGVLEDLGEGREPCETCGGQLRPYGAFGAQVVFDCLGCKERTTVMMEGWDGEDEYTNWEDEEDEDE